MPCRGADTPRPTLYRKTAGQVAAPGRGRRRCREVASFSRELATGPPTAARRDRYARGMGPIGWLILAVVVVVLAVVGFVVVRRRRRGGGVIATRGKR